MQVRIPNDITLAYSEFSDVFKQFANNQDEFRKVFKQAFEKMLDLGATFQSKAPPRRAPPGPAPPSETKKKGPDHKGGHHRKGKNRKGKHGHRR